MIRLVIKRAVASQNATMWKHWTAYTAERDAWFYLLRSKLIPWPDRCEIKAYAVIISYRERTLDFGNLVGGAKPIPDGLKKLGYLRDDSPRWFDCEYAQEQCPKDRERTVIALSYDRELTVEEVKHSTFESTPHSAHVAAAKSESASTQSPRLEPEPSSGVPVAKKKSTKAPSGTDRDSFTSEQLKKIKALQDDVLRAREKLRNVSGALKEAQNELYNGLAEGLQLEMHFGKHEDEEEPDEDALNDEPEEITSASAGKG